MASPCYPVSSIRTPFSRSTNRAPVLCLQLLSTSSFYTVHDHAVSLPGGTSLLSFVSDAAVFPKPSLLRDCGFDLLRPFGEESHRAMAGCGRTQEHSQDRAAAGAQRVWLGARLPQKKFMLLCSSSILGVIENHNTHLAPGFALYDLVPASANVAVLWGLLGPGCLSASTKCPSSSGTASPCVAQEPPHQSTARYQAVELPTRCTPPVYSLNGI